MSIETTIQNKEAIDAWVKEASDVIQAEQRRQFDKLEPDHLEIMYGKKYARIVLVRAHDARQRSCWGFIDIATGDVLKSAGWNKPAPKARGNIKTHKPNECCNWTGPHYL